MFDLEFGNLKLWEGSSAFYLMRFDEERNEFVDEVCLGDGVDFFLDVAGDFILVGTPAFYTALATWLMGDPREIMDAYYGPLYDAFADGAQ